jgi:diacylglycerol kinase family enzyme
VKTPRTLHRVLKKTRLPDRDKKARVWIACIRRLNTARNKEEVQCRLTYEEDKKEFEKMVVVVMEEDNQNINGFPRCAPTKAKIKFA